MGKKAEVRDREAIEARVIAMANEIEGLFGLGWIDIKHHFSTAKPDEQASTCETDAIWKYRYAKLTWNYDCVAATTDQQLREIIVHEFVHVLMGPIKEHIKTADYVVELEEFATESIARVLLALMGDV